MSETRLISLPIIGMTCANCSMRRHTGVAGVPGTPGEFLWSGAQGTMFWVDPKEEMTVVYLGNTPGPIRRHYRELIKTLVLQAIAD